MTNYGMSDLMRNIMTPISGSVMGPHIPDPIAAVQYQRTREMTLDELML